MQTGFMTRRHLLLAGACALWSTKGLATAQTRVPETWPPDIRRILERGALRVALPAFDAPPFFYQGAGGLEGVDVDIARGVADALGVRLLWVRQAGSFDELVESIVRGEADMAVGKVSRTLSRARFVRFSEPYAASRHALLLNRVLLARHAQGRELKSVIRDFDGTLGVIQGSSFFERAARSFPHAKVVAYRGWDELISGLIRGEVMAVYRDEAEMLRLMQQRPDLSLTLRMVAFTDTQDTLSVVLPYRSEHLLALVNLYLSQRRPSALREKRTGRQP